VQECVRHAWSCYPGFLRDTAGIPDFRSPGTGLYAKLARLNLPYPEAVFEINFFRRNPEPFYMLAKELYPGKFRPTLTHSFIQLLASKSLLHTCFTQNIDTLERRAGVPIGKIIEAHGSFATQRCIECKMPYDDDKMHKMIKEDNIPRCENAHCIGTGNTKKNADGKDEKERGLIKPDIVFFGEGLPAVFHRAIPTLRDADLLIVMGTSLTVQPFAMLANLVREGCPRVLINLEQVGNFGSRADDVICLGKCDDIVRELVRELGWEDDLLEAWNATADSVEPQEVESHAFKLPSDESDRRKKESLQAEIEGLTSDVEKALTLTDQPEYGEKGVGDLNPSAEQTVLPTPLIKSEAESSNAAQEGKL